jgi:hypothetical protein
MRAHTKCTTWAESQSHKSTSCKTAGDTPAFFKAATTTKTFVLILFKYLYVVSIISKTEYSLEAWPVQTINTVIPQSQL